MHPPDEAELGIRMGSLYLRRVGNLGAGCTECQLLAVPPTALQCRTRTAEKIATVGRCFCRMGSTFSILFFVESDNFFFFFCAKCVGANKSRRYLRRQAGLG